MTKHLRLLLFIGLAWGQAEPDTSEIDYYQMGIDAAVQDYKDLKPIFWMCTYNHCCYATYHRFSNTISIDLNNCPFKHITLQL